MGDALLLGRETDAPAHARRHLRDALLGTAYEELADNATLALTELVTNVLVHTDSDVRMTVDTDGPQLTVEVGDDSPVVPVPGVLDPTAASGRGLLLVERLSQRWGVTRVPAAGKVVWFQMVAGLPDPAAELTADDLLLMWDLDVDGDAAPDARPEVVPRDALPEEALSEEALPEEASSEEALTEGETFRRVVLPDVPTDLLQATKARLDDVIRELTVLCRGEHEALPGDLRGLAERMRQLAVELAYVRNEIRRQALAATRSGAPALDLTLDLLPSDAPLLRAYRDALDAADELCHAGRLLMPPTPPEHARFRRWKLDRIIDQLA